MNMVNTKTRLMRILFLLISLSSSACESSTYTQEEIEEEDNHETNEGVEEMKIILEIYQYTFDLVLEDNLAISEFVEMIKEEPLSIELSDYGGFEKVGPLGRNLNQEDERITTKAGDIVLYQGNQIVMFYGSNTWSYTPLAHVSDLTNREEALGKGDITATFSLQKD